MSRLLGPMLVGASLVALATGPAAAQQSAPAPAPPVLVTPPPPPATATPAVPPKPVSAFILCDGRTGHVSGGESFGRLLLLSATAGLSEMATAKDDDTRRLKGTDGAAACDAALALEGDPYRRVQLAFAKALHLAEADKLDDALVAIRAVPAAGGAFASDWGYAHTVQPRVLLVEADLLTRLKRRPEAEATAIRAVQMAPYDVALAYRAARYLVMTDAIGPEKDAALTKMVRLKPELTIIKVSALVDAGRYAEADAEIVALVDLIAPFYTDFEPLPLLANRALVLALAGKEPESDAVAAQAKERMTTLASTGFGVNNAAAQAEYSEMLTLRQILRDADSGNARDARLRFRAHGDWLLTKPAFRIAATVRLRQGASADELIGPLADTREAMRARLASEQLAAIATEADLNGQYGQILVIAHRSEYEHAAVSAWKIGDKPVYLQKHGDKQLASTDVLDALRKTDGLPAGEAVMLQAALIAKARGFDGFVVKPGRRVVAIMGLRFGRIGTAGVPERLAFSADKVIADLTPDLPVPVPTTR